MEHVPVRMDLVARTLPDALEADGDGRLARRAPVDERTQSAHEAHACADDRRIAVGDRAHRGDLVVVRVEERERRAAHQRAVAVVEAAAGPRLAAQRAVRRRVDADGAAVRRVFAVEQPTAQPHAHVVRIDAAVAMQQRVERRERHRRIAAESAVGRAVRAGASEGVAQRALVGRPERVADRLAVDGALQQPQLPFVVHRHAPSLPVPFAMACRP